MMKPRKSRRQEYAAPPDLVVDRISDLPDSILTLILSCLPTKNAVATSLLSKRWKFMWTTIHNLDFESDIDYYVYEDQYMKFVHFVNRVLLLNGDGLLNKFRLVWHPMSIPSQQISSWITTAITRNVHEIFLWNYIYCDALSLPLSVLSYESLECLEMNGSIYVSAASVVSLPRLKRLTLDSVHFESEVPFQKLISSGCPMLNYLHIDSLDIDGCTVDFGEDDEFTYRISLPLLKHLELCDGNSDLQLTRSLELEASSLEYLKLDGHIPQVLTQGSLSSLVEANWEIYLPEYNEDIYNSIAKGVRSFQCAKALTLSHDVTWALSNATISLSTMFRRLTKLKAEVVCCYCSFLPDFIRSSDILEVLTITKKTYDLPTYVHDHSNWTAPVEVPKSLSNSLKEVSFDCYAGCDDEREIIGYMLKHGSVLEVMQITCHKDNSEGKILELVRDICRFQRKSAACKVECIISEHDASVSPQ